MNTVKVFDILKNTQDTKDLLMDYFLYITNPVESSAHSLVLSSNTKNNVLSDILHFLLEVAASNDEYVICNGIDDVCKKFLPNERLICGDKIEKFTDYHKLGLCLISHWPDHKSAKILNKIFDKNLSLFIILF